MHPEYAINCNAFPCNPRPFARRLDELCQAAGSGAIQSDEAKACLNILVQQAYGQMARLDTTDEAFRLMPIMRERENAEPSLDARGFGSRINALVTELGAA